MVWRVHQELYGKETEVKGWYPVIFHIKISMQNFSLDHLDSPAYIDIINLANCVYTLVFDVFVKW